MSPNAAKKLIKIIIPPAFWLGVWSVAALLVGRDLLLPSPWAVWRELTRLAGTAPFWLAALSTLGRIFGGLLLVVLVAAAGGEHGHGADGACEKYFLDHFLCQLD